MSKITEDIRLNWADISQFEYVIEYSYYDKKIIGVSDPNYSAYELINKVLRNVILALRLFKAGSIGFSFVVLNAILDTAIKGGSVTSSVPMEITYGTNYKLEAQQIDDLMNFWNGLKPISLVDVGDDNNFILGLRRFNSSYNRATREDKFIDLAICYEALFSKTDDGADSVTHKLALRYARLIEGDFNERIRCFRDMKKLYRERNFIMHGNPSKRDIHLEEMEQNLRKGILAYLPYYDLNLSHDDIIDDIEFN